MRSYTRQEIDSLLRMFPNDPDKRKQHIQMDVLVEWNRFHGRGTFEGATGVGKSRVGVMAAQEQFIKKPDSIVYVLAPTETLRDKDWPDEFRKWDSGDLLPKIKFICHASMEKEMVNGEVDLVIFDECHHATIPNCLFFSNNKVWKILGLTATLPTISKHEIADSEKRKLIDKLCPSIFRVPIEHAISLRLVTDFSVKVLKFELDTVTSKYPLGEKMVTEREYYDFLTRNLQLSMFAKHAKYAKFPMMQKRTEFLYNLETKKRIAKDVMKYFIKPDKRTLVFCGSIETCDELCWPYVFHSKVGLDFLELFVEKKSHYCGAVKALNEGKNIPDVDQTLVVQLTSKDRDIIQRIGRSIRWRHGVTPVVVILIAMGTVDEKWYQKAFKKFDKSRIREYIIKPE